MCVMINITYYINNLLLNLKMLLYGYFHLHIRKYNIQNTQIYFVPSNQLRIIT